MIKNLLKTNFPKELECKISGDKNSLNEIFLLITKNQNPFKINIHLMLLKIFLQKDIF